MVADHLILSAAGRDPGRALGEILPWLIVLVAVVIVGGMLIYFVRKWMAGDSSTPAEGFTLQDLRDLHARGELSDEEYQNARAAMIGRVNQASQQPPKHPRVGNDSGDESVSG